FDARRVLAGHIKWGLTFPLVWQLTLSSQKSLDLQKFDRDERVKLQAKKILKTKGQLHVFKFIEHRPLRHRNRQSRSGKFRDAAVPEPLTNSSHYIQCASSPHKTLMTASSPPARSSIAKSLHDDPTSRRLW